MSRGNSGALLRRMFSAVCSQVTSNSASCTASSSTAAYSSIASHHVPQRWTLSTSAARASFESLRFNSTVRPNNMAGLDLMAMPCKREKFEDVRDASAMLPHRKELQPQFTPHGVMLIPRNLQPIDCSTSIQVGGATSGGAGGELEVSGEGDSEVEGTQEGEDEAEPIQAIGIKTWRRLKMKKHKIRKRRRAERHKNS